MTLPPGDAPPRENPSNIGTVLVTLIVLLAAAAVAYFAFLGPAAQQRDTITINAPAPAGRPETAALPRTQSAPDAVTTPPPPAATAGTARGSQDAGAAPAAGTAGVPPR